MNNLVEKIEGKIHNSNSVHCSIMSEKSISSNPDSSNIDEYIKIIIEGEKILLRDVLDVVSNTKNWSISDMNVRPKNQDKSEVSILAYKTKTDYDILYKDPPIKRSILKDIKEKYDNYVTINEQTEEVICSGDSTKDIMEKLDEIDYDPSNAIIYNVNRID